MTDGYTDIQQNEQTSSDLLFPFYQNDRQKSSTRVFLYAHSPPPVFLCIMCTILA